MAESHLEFTKPSHVVGRYALYGRLAAGGMATVHLGRVLEVGGSARTVAVKRLHPQFCKDPEFVAMFIDEARLAARIKHPNVVETLDILTMGQELLLVMEYIRGECFSKLLRAARRKNLEPSIGVVGRIASGMLRGLHAAHEARDESGELLNVVHRDISPQNVMIDVAGLVKVLDFGVAKASARIQITRDGQMKGKLSYMSPEQLQGLPVDRRADVFACGVVLWEALTRRRLFVGEDASEVLRKILRDEVPPPSQWVPGLSPEVDQVVLRALSKDPDLRYQTAEELAIDVEKIIELAPESEVGLWLESVAGDILAKRERLLQEIERLGTSDFSFDAQGTGTPGYGSITDSDTFQRIQSWAEREAARVATDGHSAFPSEVEDLEGEPTKTVADARCVDLTEEPEPTAFAGIASSAESAIEPLPEGAYTDEPDSAVTMAEDLSFGAPARLQAPVRAAGTASVVDLPPRRNRRLLTLLAAAAVFSGLVVVTAIGVQSSPRVRTSALLPEERSAPVVNVSSDQGGAAVASNRLVGETEPASGRAVSQVSQLADPPPPLGVPQVELKGSLESEVTAQGAARDPDDVTSEERAAARVSEALAQPSKERVQAAAAAPKKVTRRAPVPRRAKPAAAAVKTAAKVDCKQPFWIDEGGIRRLKMACL